MQLVVAWYLVALKLDIAVSGSRCCLEELRAIFHHIFE